MYPEVYIALKPHEKIYRGIGALFSALPKDSFLLPNRDDLNKFKRLKGPHLSLLCAEYRLGNYDQFQRHMLEIAGHIAPWHRIPMRPIIGSNNNELLLVPKHDQVKVLRAFRKCIIYTLGLDIKDRLDPHVSLGWINTGFEHSLLMEKIGSMQIVFSVTSIYTCQRYTNSRKVRIDSFRPRLQKSSVEPTPYLMQSQVHTP